MADLSFHDEVVQAVKLYEQASRRPATRTWRMIEEYGEVEALSRLMLNGELQQGFKVLRDSDQLDKTFESVVIRHRQLFRDEEVQSAEWRLAHPHDLL